MFYIVWNLVTFSSFKPVFALYFLKELLLIVDSTERLIFSYKTLVVSFLVLEVFHIVVPTVLNNVFKEHYYQGSYDCTNKQHASYGSE